MNKYILDTSVVFKVFWNEKDQEKAIEIFRKAKNFEIEIFSSSLLWYELNNCFVVRNVDSQKTILALNIIEQQMKDNVLTIFSESSDILKKAREIASIETKGQGHISSYDATFHALALLEDAIFITADRKHYQKKPKILLVLLCFLKISKLSNKIVSSPPPLPRRI